ncbi:reverse transcriptase-like protein [Bacillus spizizenii]|nr:reverse transcriptase-like protein [Bacillus spizizenii]MCY8890361.1 reverse transcriptase-like protein [Bacillus spizizenii]MEC0842085.1 reverse transcriptase-like protein [Bacillus spizizenii]
MNIIMKTDGSCLNNGQPDASAGWAVIIKGDIETTLSGKLPGDKQTNNRAELYALLKALEWAKEHPEAKISIYSDSKIGIDGLLGDSQRKANRDIWMDIEHICPDVADQMVDVKHIDREENKEADELARKAANALIIL